MASKTDTADPDLDALLRGPSDSARLLALRRLAASGREDLRRVLEPIAQKDRSLTVRYLAQRVLRALDGAPPGFGDSDPDPAPASALASGSRQRPLAVVNPLREAAAPVPTPAAPIPSRPTPALDLANAPTTPIRKDQIPAPVKPSGDPNIISMSTLDDEPTSPLNVIRDARPASGGAPRAVPQGTPARAEVEAATTAALAAPARAEPPRATSEGLRLERAALSVLRPCLRQLSALLEDADGELAAECALALGRLRAADAYDRVAGRARSSPPDERFIKGLGEIGDPRAAEMLARFWGDLRWQALRPAIGVAACKVHSTRAEEFLRTALQEDDLAVQGAIIRHLAQSGDARFVDVLLAKLGKVQEFFEVLVIQALARFAPTQPRVVQALLERLPREPNPRTASCIISSLAEAGDPALVDAIEKLTRQRDRRVRANAVDAVIRLNVAPGAKVRILRPLLDDDDNRVRANAARLMVQLGDRSALDVLKSMLAHKDRWWRASACHALGECRPPGTAALLGRALRDPELDVRLNATKALREVDDPSVPQLLLSLLSDKNLYIRQHAVEALGNLRVTSAASAVRGVLRNETSPPAIAAALAAVARTSPPDVAAREIAPFLGHATASVRLAAVEALEPVLDAGTVGVLKPSLKDAERRVRAAAVRAYFASGQLRVVSSLYDALLADDREEQIAVAHALGELAVVVFALRDAKDPPQRLCDALRKLPAFTAEDGAGGPAGGPGRST